MRNRIAIALAFALGGASVAFAIEGCGSSNDEGTPNPNEEAGADGAADGSNGDGSASDGTGGDGGACGIVGTQCTTGGDCCSGSCDAQLKICTSGSGACKAAGDTCATANECCTVVCDTGKCGTKQCTSDHQACTTNTECCSGTCAAGDAGAMECVPLNPSCSTAGNKCTQHSDCCSKLCSNGFCAGQPSFCTQNGDICSADTECCGGVCTKAAGASVGTCSTPSVPGTPGFTVAGQVCGAGADGGVTLTDAGVPACGGDCCSRSCAPFGPTGVSICQPPSGCRPTGELCQTDNDCCGAPGTPGSTKVGSGQPADVHCSKPAGGTIGRCDNVHVCSPAGAICRLASNSCNATDECCSGTVQTHPLNCQQDLLGIPRCTVATDHDCKEAGAPVPGTVCASSADCCGLPCVPNPTAGGAPFVCGGTCVSGGGKCTTSADCCPGLPCTIAPGATSGTCTPTTSGGTDGGTTGNDGGTGGTDGGTTGSCALYGQSCNVAGDCCDGVPCTSGRCIYPVF